MNSFDANLPYFILFDMILRVFGQQSVQSGEIYIKIIEITLCNLSRRYCKMVKMVKNEEMP